jgi:hypothetical protein
MKTEHIAESIRAIAVQQLDIDLRDRLHFIAGDVYAMQKQNAALVAALEAIAGRVSPVNGPQFDRLESAQSYAAFALDNIAKGSNV